MGRALGQHAAVQQRIERARQQDNYISFLKQEVQTHHSLRKKAEWEARTEAKQDLVAQQRELAEIQAAREAEVDARRQQLAEKLAAEQRAYLQEAAALQQSSPQQRRAELADMARQLATTREAERARVAEERLAQQFSEGCDLLRTLNSKRLTEQMAAQWSQQRAERLQQRAVDAEQEMQHAQDFEAYMQAYEQRYAQDQQKRKGMQAQLTELLDQQLQRREELQQEEAEQDRHEVIFMCLGCLPQHSCPMPWLLHWQACPPQTLEPFVA
jgi:hypothetical protein